MLADRFGLELSTSSTAARDAYVDASERALTFYPGALAAYDSAIAADSRFALAHAGKAQVLMREGNVAGARTALMAVVELTAGLTEREASHIAIFDLGSSGQTEAAIAAVNKHLTAWPCDALVISIAANPNGLIGGSGRVGQKHQIAELMDSVAPRFCATIVTTTSICAARTRMRQPGSSRPCSAPKSNAASILPARSIPGSSALRCGWAGRPC
jgi:hypothetical protein